jgi:putative DNA primase/helicase
MEAHFEPQTLTELFQGAKHKVYAELEKQENLAKARPAKPIAISKGIPDCLKYILEVKPKTDESTFNKLVLNLVTGFQRAGYDQQGALEIASPFLEGYVQSTVYTSPKARTDHFKAEWEYTLKKKNYAFDCSYILGLRFPGKAFECKRCAWIERRDIPQEISSKDILEALGRNEDGDSSLFIRLFRDRFRYDHSEGAWLVFNGNVFERDMVNEVTSCIDGVVGLYQKEADRQNWIIQKLELEQKKDEADGNKKLLKDLYIRIRNLQSVYRKSDILTLAAAGRDSLGIAGDEWDRHQMTFACGNGLINLTDGSLRPGRCDDLIRTYAPVEWQGLECPSPLWEKFLSEVFDGESEVIEYLQRHLGYSLLGKATEHRYPILYGEGRNGKGTLFEALAHVLGDLAGPVESEMLLAHKFTKQSGGPTSDIMYLRGKLLVWSSETEEGRHLSTSRLKWLTGGDTLTGRVPHGKRQVTFRPTHTLFLLTNHKPHAPANDFALWSRIILIPFTQAFVDEPAKENEHKADPGLLDKLKSEASGILAWLVRGSLDYQKIGLKPPEIVKKATEAYRKDEDLVNLFLSEKCESAPDYRVKSGELYAAYRTWAQANGVEVLNLTRFGKDMKTRFDFVRVGGYVFYIGIRLLEG